jgi:hypothetical protein
MVGHLSTSSVWQIPMSRFTHSHSFSGVGLSSIFLRDSISLPVTFGMPENYCTESIIFDIAEVNLPYNTVLGQPTLY